MKKKDLLVTTLMAALVIAAGCQKKPQVAQSTGTEPAPEALTERTESTNPNRPTTGQYHDTTRGTQGHYQPSAQDQMYSRENPTGMQ